MKLRLIVLTTMVNLTIPLIILTLSLVIRRIINELMVIKHIKYVIKLVIKHIKHVIKLVIKHIKRVIKLVIKQLVIKQLNEQQLIIFKLVDIKHVIQLFLKQHIQLLVH
jgi:hypothetical protein